ncbi:MAG: EscU/YscU/HrcU family type III secretion system export apparatus switch protein [Oceanipulchritudo sp.]
MAEEDKSSKTEEPTPKRLREAHEEGNFAKAEEIQVVFGLFGALAVILFTSAGAGQRLAHLMEHVLGNLGNYRLNVDMVVEYGRRGVGYLSAIIIPVLVVGVFTGVLGGGLQSGFRLTPKAVGFKGNKLNPVNGFKQKFGKQALVKFGLDFSKFLVIGLSISFGVWRVTRHEIFHTEIAPIEIAVFIFETTLYLLAILVVSLGCIALLNFLYQKHKTFEDLRMTKQEVKDEHKQQEGDPMVKNARRQMARALAQRQMFSAVPEADLIVTNPTHFAVALRYDRLQDEAPVVLAKGKNLIAEKIKRIGRENGVPLIENKPVARGLYKLGRTGKPIPPQMFKVVAEVLAYVYRVNRRYFLEKQRRQRMKLP